MYAGVILSDMMSAHGTGRESHAEGSLDSPTSTASVSAITPCRAWSWIYCPNAEIKHSTNNTQYAYCQGCCCLVSAIVVLLYPGMQISTRSRRGRGSISKDAVLVFRKRTTAATRISSSAYLEITKCDFIVTLDLRHSSKCCVGRCICEI